MRSDQEMFELILNYARQDERIRAVMLNGSRVNPNAPKDPFQDFDVVYFVKEVAPFARNRAVADYFGEIMILQTPEDMQGSDNDGHYCYLMQFMDGTRIDLSFYALEEIPRLTADSLSLILLDKDGIIPALPPANDSGYLPKPPTEKQFFDCCNEFWWVSPYVAKGLWRGELTNAHYFLELIRGELMEMVTWAFGVRSGFQKSAGKAGKYLKGGLTSEEWTLLEQTYADAAPEHTWDALLAMGTLFRQMGHLAAEHFGYTYPEREDQAVMAFLKRIRRLPPDAKEIYDAEPQTK
ncbi:MAG TPA: aminoglycoside 6-adenylyltransferase [Anaerolineaceae bacterium]|nr:aminoglycoside 6-adenylyltransferase [Anaerolineaceae bacterium]HPN54044.1 aminoglycoside 6-adenylyltransferase [Anaerolineaceae bacterium]